MIILYRKKSFGAYEDVVVRYKSGITAPATMLKAEIDLRMHLQNIFRLEDEVESIMRLVEKVVAEEIEMV